MKKELSFTEGKILAPLLRFALPVLGSLVLQALYGAVDLYVVGRYGTPADQAAVATGAQIMMMLTNVISSLSIGTTVLLGHSIGAGKKNEAGNVIAAGIKLFACIGVAMSILVPLGSNLICTLMQVKPEAFDKAWGYLTICGAGMIFIVAYNVLGSIFRGIGDSKTPLLSVVIAAVINIAGDIFFVKVLNLAASGAALATVISQAISIIICIFVIKKRGLPFPLGKENFKKHPGIIKRTLRLGAPISVQSFMVNLSFSVIVSLVNSLGVIESAGIGVSEKLTAFIMLIPVAFSQSLSAFVAQNIGAGQQSRANKALLCGMLTSFGIGIFIFYFAFFRGDLLCSIFTGDQDVIAAGWEYMKAYAIDVLLTSWMFCFVGYFNGCGCTGFVMFQGIFSAFCIRLPIAFIMRNQVPPSLFRIGLSTPASTFTQILLCVGYFIYRSKKLKQKALPEIE